MAQCHSLKSATGRRWQLRIGVLSRYRDILLRKEQASPGLLFKRLRRAYCFLHQHSVRESGQHDDNHFRRGCHNVYSNTGVGRCDVYYPWKPHHRLNFYRGFRPLSWCRSWNRRWSRIGSRCIAAFGLFIVAAVAKKEVSS